MANVLRQKEHFSLPHRKFNRSLPRLFDQAQYDVAFQLIEEFFRRIVMVVAALIRSTNDGDHELPVLPNLRVSDGRLEFVAVLVDPALQVKGLKRFDRW